MNPTEAPFFPVPEIEDLPPGLQSLFDDRRRAICAYVEKLTMHPDRVERVDLEALSAAGLSQQDIWDVVELAAMYAFTNRMSAAMGHRPNDEYHHFAREVAPPAERAQPVS